MADEKKEKKVEDILTKTYNDALKKESEKKIGERQTILNRRRNVVMPRKYHMTDDQVKKFRAAFKERTKEVSKDIKKKAGTKFFNPFRVAGIYSSCVQSLYLLGCNEWHEYSDVYTKISEVMKNIFDAKKRSSWSKFIGRAPRQIEGRDSVTAKDDEGRIKQNMRVLQRLGGVHPYGYKLAQCFACVDIKREKDGRCYYRLNTTFKSEDVVNPFYDCQYKPVKKKVKRNVIISSELTDEVKVESK
jgi:hypothetical protein